VLGALARKILTNGVHVFIVIVVNSYNSFVCKISVFNDVLLVLYVLAPVGLNQVSR
jgi:hypothetical protein